MIKFKEIQTSLGSISESNNDLAHLVGWTSSEITKKTGIKKRFISTESETSESLAIQAARKINQNDLKSIDLIISVTNTQNLGFPSIAHVVHSELGLDKSVKCLGINAGCTGFVDAVELVYAFFQSDFASKAMIINSDTYSKFLNNERSTRTLFSDGASASIIEKDPSGFYIEKKINSSIVNTYQYLKKDIVNDEARIYMNGPQVLKFAMGTVLKDLIQIIPNEKCFLFPHQAGKLVLDLIEKKAPKNVTLFKNYQDYGNLVSASIPNLIRSNFKYIQNDFIILSGFGVGLAHNCLLLRRR